MKRLSIFFGILFGIVIGLTIASKFDFRPLSNLQLTAAPTTSLPTDTDFNQAISQVAEIVGPTVVAIRTESVQRYRPRGYFFGNPDEDELFERFFEDFFGEIPEREFRRAGFGSGVIIDNHGHILTNEHVVEQADKITVTLADGREVKGILKGTDPRSDLAVIKIHASDLPESKLGDSDQLKIGQWVVAVGNPYGTIFHNPQPTVTAGVISALHRSLPTASHRDSNYTDLIQTDAAINPGNSGGPLVNLNGEIIGINVAIFSTSGGYQGIGFAIPINSAKRIVEQLIAGKKVVYGWIGVSAQDIDHRLAQYFGLKTREGILISKVLSGGPADKAGLKDGDIILVIDNQPITGMTELLKIIGNTPVGNRINVKVLRDKNIFLIPVTVGSRPSFNELSPSESEGPTQAPEESEAKQEIQWRGLKVRNIPPEIDDHIRRDAAKGIFIVDITENSPSQEAGLRKGDIITSVNKNMISGLGDFDKAVKKSQGDCLIRTLRGYFVVKEKVQ